MQRTIDEARLAAIKLRAWTGEKGMYAKLFDERTTMRLDSNWLFFDVEGLSSGPEARNRHEYVLSRIQSRLARAERQASRALPLLRMLVSLGFPNARS